MRRAMWTGSISFGLVNCPVKMFKAVDDLSVSFKQINSENGHRIRQPKVDADTGQEVEYEKIIKGYEIAEDRIVVIDPSELNALAPAKTKQIAIEQFVDADELDPLAFDSGYYLGPNKGGAKAYALLCSAMERAGRVAIGRVVMRSRERLVAIRAQDGVLISSTLVFADEIDSPIGYNRIDGEPPQVTEAELQMADRLVESLTGEFDHSAFKDEYRLKVMQLVEAKAAGETLAEPEPAQATPPTADLLGALEASLEQTPTRKPRKSPARKPKAPAKAKSNGRKVAA